MHQLELGKGLLDQGTHLATEKHQEIQEGSSDEYYVLQREYNPIQKSLLVQYVMAGVQIMRTSVLSGFNFSLDLIPPSLSLPQAMVSNFYSFPRTEWNREVQLTVIHINSKPLG